MGSHFKSYEENHPNTIFLQIDESTSSFCFKNSDTVTITLPVGYAAISERYFKHTPPTYDEVEYAINYIEDEIEKVAPEIARKGYHLVTDTPFIRNIAQLCGVETSKEMALSREAHELVFGQYAEIAMGRPPRPHESDISPRFYAQMLILREYLHHLLFEQVTVIEQVK
ncbi:MAG: hypothetical protein C0624_06940 [Desulfuromonas sp.]|nr:MAG: hypothetical protein C0624_06940 [Desulfuromonas sp.]